MQKEVLEDYMYNFRTTKAFTLAEVLVTLGIIGVVSAMTLPTLVKSHQRQVYVTQLHKVYNEFSQAGESYINSKNAINLSEAGVRTNAGIQEFVQSSIKTVKNCGSTFTDCFASEYQNMNGATVANLNDATAACYALPSGATVCLTRISGQIANANFISLIVDTNGKQGPNILGRDLFIMAMGPDGSVIPSQYTYQGGAIADCVNAAGNKPDACKELELSKLENCSQAGNMVPAGPAAYCFSQLLEDGWQMEY